MPGKTYKIIVLGANGTGKSSIIEQALHGNQVVGMQTVPTIEDTYTANILTERNLTEQLRFYDTAGLDCQTPVVSKHYYSLADAYILVFDITKWETFHCLNALKADIDKNKDKKEVPVILVLGNKSDLEHSSRQIETETVNKWAVREKVHFREVTITNKKGLMDAFSYLASKLSPQRSIKNRFKKDNTQLGFAAIGPAADV